MFRQRGGNLLRYATAGAQRASTSGRGTRTTSTHTAVTHGAATRPWSAPHHPFSFRAIAAVLLAAIVAAGGMTILATPDARAAAQATGLKAVIIVGPASSSTSEYLDEGERIARSAEAQGMDVRRIFTPRATWKRVKENIQGANLVVYLGHGNGWPSSMGPFRGESKDGLGLNACDNDCGTSSPTKYFGEDFIRSEVKLAPNSVVFLHRLCYASGNAESGMAPVFDKTLAVERASNFASGFLDAGAGVVFALGWKQKMDLPELLAQSDKTMDEIFMTKGSDGDYYDGFMGTDDYYRASTRTRGARVHMDPHKRFGHLRAITGDLTLTANVWRGETPPPDDVPPTLQIKGTGTTDDSRTAAAGDVLTFSPNGDGVADRMLVKRSLSEPAYVDIEVVNADGTPVRSFTTFGEKGGGDSYWDGHSDRDRFVPDGLYHVDLTPRDRAGNVGETASVDVRVLTTLRRLQASVDAINVSDGDNLAASVVLTAQLKKDATVTWQVRHDGDLVRSRYSDERVAAGALTWKWDGTDAIGKVGPDGHYVATISATTDGGTLHYSVPITVGNWRVTVNDRTPSRGDKVDITAISLEPLDQGVQLEVSQPGLPTRLIDMQLTAKHTLSAVFQVAKKAGSGRIGLRIIAQDTGGQQEITSLSLRLR